jgi:hypothetical protein
MQDRWDWSVARAYAPTAAALAAAFVASLAVSQARAQSVSAATPAGWDWTPYALFVLAGALGLWTTARLWRTRRTADLLCRCGGLLGPERPGRGGELRCVCRACGRSWRRRGRV